MSKNNCQFHFNIR